MRACIFLVPLTCRFKLANRYTQLKPLKYLACTVRHLNGLLKTRRVCNISTVLIPQSLAQKYHRITRHSGQQVSSLLSDGPVSKTHTYIYLQCYHYYSSS